MKNFHQTGDNLTITAATAGKSGDGRLVGDLFGFLMADVQPNEEVELKLVGVFSHSKVEAQAWILGASIYWDDTAKLLTTTASGNKKVGHAAAVAANPSTTGFVRLSGASG